MNCSECGRPFQSTWNHAPTCSLTISGLPYPPMTTPEPIWDEVSDDESSERVSEFLDSPVGQALQAGGFPVWRDGQIEAAAAPFKSAYFLSDEDGRARLIHDYPDRGLAAAPDAHGKCQYTLEEWGRLPEPQRTEAFEAGLVSDSSDMTAQMLAMRERAERWAEEQRPAN